MNKLYHIFNVYSYKGGELNSYINLTFDSLVEEVDIDIDELRETFADDERSKNISNEEFYKLSDLELLNIIPDDIIKYCIKKYFYPGNIYAFDTYSDYKIYTTLEDGSLKEINPIEIPGFVEAVKDNLRYYAEKYRE